MLWHIMILRGNREELFLIRSILNLSSRRGCSITRLVLPAPVFSEETGRSGFKSLQPHFSNRGAK